MNETGRADTTVVADSAIRARIDTAQTDTTTTQVTPTPQVQPEPMPAPTPAPAPIPAPDSSRVGRDTSSVQPRAPGDTTGNNSSVLPDSVTADSGNVPHRADKFEGDSAMVEHNAPDSTGKAADSTGR